MSSGRLRALLTACQGSHDPGDQVNRLVRTSGGTQATVPALRPSGLLRVWLTPDLWGQEPSLAGTPRARRTRRRIRNHRSARSPPATSPVVGRRAPSDSRASRNDGRAIVAAHARALTQFGAGNGAHRRSALPGVLAVWFFTSRCSGGGALGGHGGGAWGSSPVRRRSTAASMRAGSTARSGSAGIMARPNSRARMIMPARATSTSAHTRPRRCSAAR